MYRTRASEFPNDNPDLHDGALWICAEPCGPLETVLSLELQAPPQEPEVEEPEVALQLEPEPEPQVEPELELEPELSTEDGVRVVVSASDEAPKFRGFVQILASIALAEGATRAAAALPDLLEHGAVGRDALDDETTEALLASGLVERTDRGLAASERLSSLVRAWRSVLNDGDFSACGSVMLHEWASELLAAALASPQRVVAMQYELRRRGVAAFGLVKLAA